MGMTSFIFLMLSLLLYQLLEKAVFANGRATHAGLVSAC
jgi:hypothetical protein